MNWYLVDERTAGGVDIFEEKLNATNKMEAIREATREWYVFGFKIWRDTYKSTIFRV